MHRQKEHSTACLGPSSALFDCRAMQKPFVYSFLHTPGRLPSEKLPLRRARAAGIVFAIILR